MSEKFTLSIEGGDEWHFHGMEGQIRDENGDCIAVGQADTPEQIAQLTMLAASSDLYAACKAALEDGPHNASCGLSARVVEQLQAALKKAVGE